MKARVRVDVSAAWRLNLIADIVEQEYVRGNEDFDLEMSTFLRNLASAILVAAQEPLRAQVEDVYLPGDGPNE